MLMVSNVSRMNVRHVRSFQLGCMIGVRERSWKHAELRKHSMWKSTVVARECLMNSSNRSAPKRVAYSGFRQCMVGFCWLESCEREKLLVI
jgi:hypothetical protein